MRILGPRPIGQAEGEQWSFGRGGVVVAVALALDLRGPAPRAGRRAAAAARGSSRTLKPVKPPSPCPNTDGVSAGTIKVGAILPETGPTASSFQASEDGMRARFDLANAHR